MRPLRDIEKLLIGFFTIFAIVGCTVFIFVCARVTPKPAPSYIIRGSARVSPDESMWGLYLGMNAEKFDANANGLTFKCMENPWSSPTYVCRIDDDVENELRISFDETDEGEFVLSGILIQAIDRPELTTRIYPTMLNGIDIIPEEAPSGESTPSLKGLNLGMTVSEFEAADLGWDVKYTFLVAPPEHSLMYLECHQKTDEAVSLILAFQQDDVHENKNAPYQLANIEQGRFEIPTDEFETSDLYDGLWYHNFDARFFAEDLWGVDEIELIDEVNEVRSESVGGGGGFF